MSIGTPKIKIRSGKWSHESLFRLQVSLGLSDKRIVRTAAALRVVGGRRNVEEGLREALKERNRQYLHLFEAKTFSMKVKPPMKKRKKTKSNNDNRSP